MAPSHKSRPSARDIFTYDPDAPEYKNIPSDASDDEEEAHDVLREEEEREKLLAGGLFSGITKKGSIKIGKSVKGSRGRRSAAEVASGMGGKRLGMEDGGEFGLDYSESEDEEMEEEKKVCFFDTQAVWRKGES
jgi:hypothetical protein